MTGTFQPATMSSGYSLDALRAFGWCSATRGGLHCLAHMTGMLTLACVHEHLHTFPVCAACLTLTRTLLPTTAGVICHRCRDCDEPHDCHMTEVRWEPS